VGRLAKLRESVDAVLDDVGERASDAARRQELQRAQQQRDPHASPDALPADSLERRYLVPHYEALLKAHLHGVEDLREYDACTPKPRVPHTLAPILRRVERRDAADDERAKEDECSPYPVEFPLLAFEEDDGEEGGEEDGGAPEHLER